MTLREFEKEVLEVGKRFGAVLPNTEKVRESIQKSYELGLYSENAYWRALDE